MVRSKTLSSYTNFESICRLCLLQERRLISIFNDSKDKTESDLPLKIKDCVFIEVRADNEPQKICEKCLDFIDSWFKFKELCQNTNTILKQYLLKSCPAESKTMMELIAQKKIVEELPVPTPDVNLFESDSLFENLEENTSCTVSDMSSILKTFYSKSNHQPVQNFSEAFDKEVFSEDKQNNTTPHFIACDKNAVSINRSENECSLFSIGDLELIRVDSSSEMPMPLSASTPLSANNNTFIDEEEEEEISDDPLFSPSEFLNSVDENGELKHDDESEQEQNSNSREQSHSNSKNDEICYIDNAIELDDPNQLLVIELGDPNQLLVSEPPKNSNTQKILRNSENNRREVLKDKNSKKSHEILKNKKRKDRCNIYKCDLCVEEFTKFNELLKHDDSDHSITKRSNCCDKCHKLFVTENRLKIHQSIMHKEKLFECDLCFKKYSTKRSLQSHARLHTGLFKCNLCNFVATHSKAVETHIAYKHEEPSIKCDVCEKLFPNRSNLNRHMKSHAILERYKCHICSRTFNLAENLKNHILIHDDSNPATCDICGKTVKNLRTLQMHMKSIHQPKKFSCKQCEKDFANNSKLQKHMLGKHSVFKHFICDICDGQFSYKQSLVNHIAKYHLFTHL